ncbi:synaptobrevin like YKT6 [Babesia ovis]|uniref:Synaptobrevin like YKT6 n=1 Tax=Babesia ovis TaxID=5869 RepID=A0A9W5WUK1_BABOV|nr:synaptobrevin like YKT6 [Babesia ovis]
MSDWFGSVVNSFSSLTQSEPKKSNQGTNDKDGCHIYAVVVMRHYAQKESCRLTAEYDFSPLPMYMAKISREVTDLVSRTTSQEALPDESKCVDMENNMGMFYVKATNDPPPSQLVFIVAVNKHCTRYQALQFLQEAMHIYKVQDDVYRDNTGEALKCPELRSLMQQYKGKRDVLVDAQSKLDEGNLDELIAKSQDMTQSTARLMRDARRRNSCCSAM